MIFRLALVLLWRNRKSAELRILSFALGLAIFSVTLLSCFTQALGDMFVKDATSMIGADLIIESPRAFSAKLLQVIENKRLVYSQNVEFLSMLSINNQRQLANVNAISLPFPLRGELSVEKAGGGIATNQIPQPGEIWLEMSLMQKLDASLNQYLEIGNLTLKITGVIKQHPLALSSSSLLAPLAYVNYNDLKMMGVLQAGSRVTYRILIGSNVLDTSNIQKILQNDLPKDVNIITPHRGRRGFSKIMLKVQQYLSIILLIQVLLAGITVGLCAHQYSLKQKRNVALMRCLGARSGTLFSIHIIQLLTLAFLMMFMGIAMAYAVALIALYYAKTAGFYNIFLSSNGGISGALTGLLLLLGFALPPIIELRKVSPSQIFQEVFVKNVGLQFGSYSLAIISLLVLFFMFVREPYIGLQLAILIYIFGAIAYGLSWIVWFSFKPLSQYGGLVWRFSLTYLLRHKNQSIIQWLVFAVVIMLLVLVQIIKQDFLEQWRAQLPKETPNYFLLNVQPEQIKPLQKWLNRQGIMNVEFYPIVRGRLSHINGQPLMQDRGLLRSLNLTWMSQLPKDNQVVVGPKWEPTLKGKNVVTVEQGFAQRHNLQVNDTLSFQIEETMVTAKIIQIRALEWTSFKPNFFFIFPDKILNDFPHTFISSIYVSNDKKVGFFSLTKEFAEISIIDIDEIVLSIRKMIEKLSIALDSLLIIVFVLGILIMYSSLLSSLKDRIHESAMLQILGANKSFIAKILVVEFGLLGLFSGAVGSSMAMFLAKDLAARYFDMVFILNIKWFWYTTFLSTLVIACLGLIGARSVFQISPLWLLKQSS